LAKGFEECKHQDKQRLFRCRRFEIGGFFLEFVSQGIEEFENSTFENGSWPDSGRIVLYKTLITV
jgi:hypothetical protein